MSRALGDVEHKLVRLNLDSIDPPLALGKDDIVRLGAEKTLRAMWTNQQGAVARYGVIARVSREIQQPPTSSFRA